MSLELSPEQLCQTRYLVTENYPHSPYKIGDIVTVDQHGDFLLCLIEYPFDAPPLRQLLHHSKTHEYPALFRTVPWFYGRQEGELPKYLEYVGHNEKLIGTPCQVDKWDVAGPANVFFRTDPKRLCIKWAGDYRPISKERYEELIKTKV